MFISFSCEFAKRVEVLLRCGTARIHGTRSELGDANSIDETRILMPYDA